jgi:hypothetical protein
MPHHDFGWVRADERSIDPVNIVAERFTPGGVELLCSCGSLPRVEYWKRWDSKPHFMRDEALRDQLSLRDWRACGVHNLIGRPSNEPPPSHEFCYVYIWEIERHRVGLLRREHVIWECRADKATLEGWVRIMESRVVTRGEGGGSVMKAAFAAVEEAVQHLERDLTSQGWQRTQHRDILYRPSAEDARSQNRGERGESPDPVHALKQLGELRECGVLTEGSTRI